MADVAPGAAGPGDQESSDEKILEAARDDYKRARDAWAENQQEARGDLEFARLGKQWDSSVAEQRRRENRPCLTFNKMPAFIRQVEAMMRTPDGTRRWYLRAIDELARAGADVRTVSIHGEDWQEVDFPEDVVEATALTGRWAAAAKAAAA